MMAASTAQRHHPASSVCCDAHALPLAPTLPLILSPLPLSCAEAEGGGAGSHRCRPAGAAVRARPPARRAGGLIQRAVTHADGPD